MASDQGIVDYLCEQAGLGARLSHRKMFGEYALYLDGKVVALVCDNQLFVKPTAEGKAILGNTQDLPPYPGAKPHFRLDAEIEDRELYRQVLVRTVLALPMPKPRSSSSKRGASRAPAGKVATLASVAKKLRARGKAAK